MLTRRAGLAACAAVLSGAAAPVARLVVQGQLLSGAGTPVPCTVGWRGIRADKREGDGATPAGTFPLRRVLFRPDRMLPPQTGLPVQALSAADAWCDDPADPAYNQPIHLPHATHHEVLWRTDGLYDLVVPLGYNDAPAVPGRGSAIFLHVARPDSGPTEGCVAIGRAALLSILQQCGPGTAISIHA